MYEYKGSVISVYDGDTVRADLDLGLSTWRRNETLRLFGINTPELRGDTREAGLIARDALAAKVLGQKVIINTIQDNKEKWGRYLATIELDDGSGLVINEWLIEHASTEACTWLLLDTTNQRIEQSADAVLDWIAGYRP